MTASRGLLAAVTAGSLALGLSGNASAQAVNNITGNSSETDTGCLGLLQVVGNPRCQFDGEPFSPAFPGAGSNGPVGVAGYYQVGQSPWDVNMAPDANVGPAVGDGKYEPPLLGTVTINNQGTFCDADDTIAAEIGYGAATRAFAGGPGTRGEETWGDGDLSFTLPATVVSSATPNAGGCDYVIGDAGAPPLLVTAGGAEFGDDVDIGREAGQVTWLPVDAMGDYEGNLPSVSSLEANPNTGAPMTVTNGPTYNCDFFNGGIVDCENTGSHHEVMTSDTGTGDRGAIENSIWVISTDAGGTITSGTAYVLSENPVGGFSQPQWLTPRWEFVGDCPTCPSEPTAVDDSGSTLSGTPVDINVLANDANLVDDELVDSVTVNVVADATLGDASCTVNGSPGLVGAVSLTYTPDSGGAVGVDTCSYEVDTTFNGAPFTTNTAVVSVTVEEDAVPVAPDSSLTLDTQGQQGAAAAESVDVSTLGGYEPGNGNPVCTISTAATSGTAVCNGTTVTYTPNNDFVNGGDMDSFEYQLEDDQGDLATGTIDVDITNVQPALIYAAITTDEGADGNSAATVTPGNGTPAQHSIAVTTDASDGSCTVNADFSVTYTPDDGFSGSDSCTVTLTDADGDDADGVVAITVNETTNEIEIRLPGGKSSMDLVSLLLLGGLPFLRRRRQR